MIIVQDQPRQKRETLLRKSTKAKRVGVVAEGAEHLPSKTRLNSNPSSTEKDNNNNKPINKNTSGILSSRYLAIETTTDVFSVAPINAAPQDTIPFLKPLRQKYI
jgi:hypothetical protein